MPKEKGKKKILYEAQEWCRCDIHKIDYPCSEGCPKCK